MNMQNKTSHLPMIGPVGPLPLTDVQYFYLMVTDKHGYVDQILLAIVLKYYPTLSRFVTTSADFDLHPAEEVKQLLSVVHLEMQTY